MNGAKDAVRALKVSFGAVLAEKRKQAGLSQEKLAEMIGLSQESLSKIEKGLQAPRFERLYPLSKALGCRVEDLFKFGPRGSVEYAESLAGKIQSVPESGRKALEDLVDNAIRAMTIQKDDS